MTCAYFTHEMSTAFEETVGEVGASRTRYDYWRAELMAKLPGLKNAPVPEAASIHALATRTDDLAEIEEVARYFASNFTDLMIVGMGGSSLNGQVLAAMRKNGGLKLHITDNIDPTRTALMVSELPWATTAFLVVSKSGGTVETNALLAIFLREAAARGLSIAKHFIAITIPNDNPVHRLALAHGMRVIAHDPDMCGRFAILSAVGLIPAAAVGVNIRALRAGAAATLACNFEGTNDAAIDGAALHMALLEKRVTINMLMHYCDRIIGFSAWVRQIWAESLGKNSKGTLMVPSRGATDQHSQLQLFLEGSKDKFFTSIVVDSRMKGAEIGFAPGTDTRLDYLSGHRLGDLFFAQQRATNETLVAAGRPLRTLTCATLDEETLGALIMHFSLEVVFVAALLGVNAFDQPAVETSKKLALKYLAGA